MDRLEDINKLTDHLFRQQSGKMVSVLTKIFGTENLETAEDVVQQTFIDAISHWEQKGIPDKPEAWLFRVAKNKAIDIIRRNKFSANYDFSDNERTLLRSEYTLAVTIENFFREEIVNDELLGMMFACCHPGISQENQIAVILKTLCGFSTFEIAKAFVTTEDTISKRLYRTKEFFRENKIKPEIPAGNELKKRTGAVLNSIYLLFNEGYNSTHSEKLIRDELISEAMTLCKLLSENKHTQLPEVFALMALMCFHAARSESRLTNEGEIILLPFQDRRKWNRDLIATGNRYMNIAAFGDSVSPYHIEAAIAYEHCSAGSFEKTNWKQILKYYEWLCKVSPSPVIELNKVVAIMQVNGPDEALKALLQIQDRTKLESYYLYHSLLGEIYSKLEKTKLAKQSFESAIELTQSDSERKILKNKIAELLIIKS